jgi:hypothetical protein
MLPGYLHFSFRLRGGYYPCAVVRWFNRVGNTLDETDLWMVKPSSIESIFGTEPLPTVVKSHHVLTFILFYVNRYADPHAFGIACRCSLTRLAFSNFILLFLLIQSHELSHPKNKHKTVIMSNWSLLVIS